jgi:hypothetical protein
MAMVVAGLVGTVKKPNSVRLFQAAVEIRVLCGFPSAASVSTGLSLSVFSLLMSVPAFPQKNIAPRIA